MNDEDTRALLAGVIGWPIAHSKSPRLFDHWFAVLGIPGRYVPLAVQPEDFEAVLRALPKAGFRGANVTAPHKEMAFALADDRTDRATAIGAANTLVFAAGGQVLADNTDAFGFFENLRAGAGGWDPSGAPGVVLGAGGASLAVVYALLDAGVPSLTVVNRSRDRADALASRFGPNVRTADWADRGQVLGGAGLLVNTTVLGMTGKPALEIALDRLPQEAVVHDIVYAPLETPLLAAARARGNIAVDGLGMLLHQARPGFRAWFGADPDVDAALRKAVLS
ncbi:MAG: shikimate dehydrogenase [Pseudomonadota bacterium]